MMGRLPLLLMMAMNNIKERSGFNGWKLSSQLQRPQVLAPFLDVDKNDVRDGSDDEVRVLRGRDSTLGDRSKSLRRRARSMSPLRSNDAFQWLDEFFNGGDPSEIKEKLELKCEVKAAADGDGEAPASCGSSRSSSVGRSSRHWVFLKVFLYRSKSEGRSSTSTSNHKFWTSLSLSSSSKQSQVLD